MTAITDKTAELMDILPASDQTLVYELVKKMVLAWDPDFTKVTPMEARAIQEAEEEFRRGDVVAHDAIDWG